MFRLLLLFVITFRVIGRMRLIRIRRRIVLLLLLAIMWCRRGCTVNIPCGRLGRGLRWCVNVLTWFVRRLIMM